MSRLSPLFLSLSARGFFVCQFDPVCASVRLAQVKAHSPILFALGEAHTQKRIVLFGKLARSLVSNLL